MADYLNTLAAFGSRPSLGQMIDERRALNSQTNYRNLLGQQVQSEMAGKNTLRELYGQYASGDEAALQKIASVDPSTHMAIQKNQQAQAASQRELQEQQAQKLGRMAIWANDEQKWAATPWGQKGVPFDQREQVLGQYIGYGDTLKTVQDMNKQPDSIRTLEILAQRPDLRAVDEGRRRAGATTINNIPKPDFGYVYNDPNDPTKGVTVVPGSKADIERQKVETALENKRANVVSSSQNVLDAITQAKGLVGRTSTGIPGAMLSGIPSTDAYNLERTVETIKANIGFDRLQAMREASPTGGALGQVAVQELNALQASIANLDPKQGKDLLMKNLEKIERHYRNWLNTVNQSQEVQQPSTGVRFLGFE